MAHEIGHNFGSLHDGDNKLPYERCNSETGNEGLMGGNLKIRYMFNEILSYW